MIVFPTEALWMIHPAWFNNALPQLRNLDARAFETQAAAPARPRTGGVPTQSGRIAFIEITGPLSKYQSLWSYYFGGTAMLETAVKIRAATLDPNIDGVLLYIDSPGGTVAGTLDLADAVYRARESKPVVALISDLGASAAYWIASQASHVIANSTAMVGSIGTYMVIPDWSKAYESEGIKVHVVRAGDFKGAGLPGTTVTDEQIADFQRIIDSQNRQFLGGVARGRGLPPDRVRALNDGRIHVGAEAKRENLVDAIGGIDDALAELAQRLPKRLPQQDLSGMRADLAEARIHHVRKGHRAHTFSAELQASQPDLFAAASAAGLLSDL